MQCSWVFFWYHLLNFDFFTSKLESQPLKKQEHLRLIYHKGTCLRFLVLSIRYMCMVFKRYCLMLNHPTLLRIVLVVIPYIVSYT